MPDIDASDYAIPRTNEPFTDAVLQALGDASKVFNNSGQWLEPVPEFQRHYARPEPLHWILEKAKNNAARIHALETALHDVNAVLSNASIAPDVQAAIQDVLKASK